MKRGQITVFFSLLLPLLLSLLGAALESACEQAVRSRIQRSLMLCEYSFLSEYQKDLWETYGLFYLDAGYGGQVESQEAMKVRLLDYLRQNLSWEEDKNLRTWTSPPVSVRNIEIHEFSRMTDDGGMGFYEQAVAYTRNLWGMDILDSWLKSEGEMKELMNLEEERSVAEERERRNLDVLRRRRLEAEEIYTEDPTDGIRQTNEGLLSMVVKDAGQLSAKTVSLQEIPSKRGLLAGIGSAERFQGNVINDQWFHAYLLEHCVNAKEVLLQEKQEGVWLSYELEYILAGKGNDLENLKAVVNRLLLLREGANYAYLMTDEAKKQEAYVLAAIVAGLTLMPEIVEALQQVILLAWAYGESVIDIRSLLQGGKVALAKTSDSWKLPLAQLFFLRLHLDKYDEGIDENGLDYEGYLRMLLSVMGRQDKCMRGLDVIEGCIRKTQLGKCLYVDQCVDGFSMKAEFGYSSVFSFLAGKRGEESVFVSERNIAYEW